MRSVILVLILLSAGCSTFQRAGIPLQPTVAKFNDHLRWKRYDAAARLITPEEQSTFYEALSDVEETLDIQNIEVRHVSVQHTEPVKARVIVRSQSTQLPSTIVKTVTQTQIWEHRGQGWILIEVEPDWLPSSTTKRTDKVQISTRPH